MDKHGGLRVFHQELMHVFNNTLVATAKLVGFEIKSTITPENYKVQDDEWMEVVIEVISGDQVVLKTNFKRNESMWWITTETYFPLWNPNVRKTMTCNLVKLLEEMGTIMDYLEAHRPRVAA